GNGDITNVVTATKMYEETGCAGIAVARGARGNPWIFKSLIMGEDYKPSKEEVINMMIKHLNSLLEIKGEYTAIREMRAHASWYTAGMYGSTEFRRNINMCNTKEELIELIEKM
ncbi:MAG: tRNA-dihydrouridine synthase, partial [Lachnospiraceae bacterium]|nr:tRNA-dihydrouridine synthase [Lachnospiraceae bacterium]